MQLFYTGAASFQAVQNDPNLSLGGYISSSPVPNNGLNNIFSDFSWQTAQQKKVAVRGLILQNTLGFNTLDVLFGYQYPTSIGATFRLEVAFVSLNPTAPTLMEKIPNGENSPIFATFTEANIVPAGANNSVDIGPLANGASIGLWLRLTVLTTLTPPGFNTVDDQLAWWKNISDPAYSTLQTIQINIKYTY